MALTIELGNPIRVTGTASTAEKIIEPTILKGVYVSLIYWFQPTTAGHLCTLKTKKGKYIAELRAESNNQSERLEPRCYFDDIYCDDMDSGTLYIYTR